MSTRFCVYRPLPGGARHKLQVGSSLPPLQLQSRCLSAARSCSGSITLPTDRGKSGTSLPPHRSDGGLEHVDPLRTAAASSLGMHGL